MSGNTSSIASTQLFAEYPPATQPADAYRQLTAVAVDHAALNTLLYVAPGPQQPLRLQHAPFALYPSLFPRHLFDKAAVLQPLFNTLVERVVRQRTLLDAATRDIARVDPFTRSLLAIYDACYPVQGPAPRQSFHLGIFRSDYLMHDPCARDDGPTPLAALEIQQVELNTISSSFGSLSSKVGNLHHHLRNRYAFGNSDLLCNHNLLPESTSLPGFASALARAHEKYLECTKNPSENVVILFVGQPNERNVFDQRLIERLLFDKYGIRAVRYTHAQVAQYLAEKVDDNVSNPDGRLLLKDQICPTTVFEISVAYFRSGYTPSDYIEQRDWDTRLTIEKSLAIKCPSIPMHLAGAKKIQQLLAAPGVLEQFFSSPQDVALLRSCFTGLYPLDETNETEALLQKTVYKNPERYVMKPQREGGGNNIYGSDIPPFISSLPSKNDLRGYILMDLIEPPEMKNVLVRDGAPIPGKVICELGMYGTYLGEIYGDKQIFNEVAGHLLRTKLADSHEGGVAAGFAVIDSPVLV